ncbi:hypothetical protein ACLGAT_05815 [Helicobacter pylori]
MFYERSLKIIPAVVFLFCVLEIFEIVLIIISMNKTEKLEYKIRNDLKALEGILVLENEHLKGMQLEHFENKEIKIK